MVLNQFEEENVYASIAGWASVGCWMVVFTPQIYKNYVNKSGEGLSMRFLIIWLIGDIFNIAGVAIEKLLATMLILAVYYTIADLILIFQVYYYRHLDGRQGPLQPSLQTSFQPSLQPSFQPSLQPSDEEPRHAYVPIEDEVPPTPCFCGDVCTIIAATIVMTSSVLFSVLFMQWYGVAQYFGWCSALLYVASRLPQITKNRRNESTKGLAFGMFLFGILGNALYCLSIFLQSTETGYIRQNLPWLVGSGGTLLLDVFIGIQFMLYRQRGSAEDSVDRSA